MTEAEIKKIVEAQRAWFRTGATLDVRGRLAALERIRAWITGHEGEIHTALRRDLGKSALESYMCETGMVLGELRYMLAHTRALSRPRAAPSSPAGAISSPRLWARR